MKVIKKPIDMVCSFNISGEMKLHRFRLLDEVGEDQVIHINKQMTVENIKIGGTEYRVFTCQITLDSILCMCEIRYDLKKMQFTLFKL